jgi:putative FmdB family regulatory protein
LIGKIEVAGEKRTLMPIYEYECKKCKAHIEVLQKMSDKPLVKCRRCGGRLEKQWSATGFQFVGSGWYVTDYAGKKTEDKSAAKETGTASSSDKDSTAKESKAKDSKGAAPTKANSSSNTSGD